MYMHTVNTKYKMGVTTTYTSSLDARFDGASSLCPSASIVLTVNGEKPPYGIFPPLNTSHTVIPNDHCIHGTRYTCTVTH